MLRLPAARVENTFVRGVDFGTPWGVGLRCAVYRYYGVFLFVRFRRRSLDIALPISMNTVARIIIIKITSTEPPTPIMKAVSPFAGIHDDADNKKFVIFSLAYVIGECYRVSWPD